MKTYTFSDGEETYTMTMNELVENITREFAKTLLTNSEFDEFVTKQEQFFEDNRKRIEEYSRTHHILQD